MSKQTELVGLARTTNLDEVNAAYSAGALSNRNLIINGAMNVAQRGTSSTAHGFHTVDRFRASSDGTMVAAVVTQSQDTTGPDGFSNSYKVSVNTPETVSNLDYYYVSQCIEAQNLQHLDFGLSSAQGLTLSFWVRSSVTGTYTLNLYRQDAARCFPKTYTVDSANVWEKKTISLSGDTTGVIENDNGRGIEIYWTLSAGSNYTTGTDGVWAAYVGSNFSANHTADIIGTTGATWQITGVQLEVGDTATPFEHRSYGDELQRCQRYYQAIALNTSRYINLTRFAGGSGVPFGRIDLPVTMRTAPTLSQSGTWLSTTGYAGTPSLYAGDSISVRLAGSYNVAANVTVYASGGNVNMDAEL